MALGSTRDRTADGGGIYIGTVTRVTGSTCYVEVPRYAKGFELGPCRYPAELAGANTLAGSAGGAYDGAPSHTHPLRQLAPGDDVAVAFLEGGDTDAVVLVRLA